jgi:4-hydroxybenzoate polyprenyltransferase
MTNAYIRLMRLDKPIGSFLLWYPTAWTLWAANNGIPSLSVLFLFMLGTIIMRSAGCVINDISDRNLDKFVTRTKMRPLTRGEISLKSALLVVVILLFMAFFVLLCLPVACVTYALLALVLTIVYPLCKRFINAPQLILGLAFSMGIPMAYAASGVPLNSTGFLLLIINMLWIIAYDTLYAMADKKDDMVIGIKSTAIYFGSYDRSIVAFLQVTMHFLWLCWASTMQMSLIFYLFWGLAALILFWQQWLIRNSTPKIYIQAFLINNYYGALMWAAIVLGFLQFN